MHKPISILGTIFLLCLLTFNLKANHYSVGYINYRYIGDSIGLDSNTYEFEVGIYHFNKGLIYDFVPATTNIIVTPPNGIEYSITLNLITPDTPAPGYYTLRHIDISTNCADTNSSALLLVYRGNAVLDKGNGQYTFIPSTISCCRDYFDNLLNSHNTQLGIYAKLFKTNNHNSLPKPIYEHMLAKSCINQHFEMIELYPDSDLDSALYKTKDALNFDANANSLVPIAWAQDSLTTLSKNQAIFIDSSGYYTANPNTGNISCKPSQIGLYLIPREYVEYRFDSLTNSYYEVGSMHFEGIVEVSGNCNSISSSGASVSFSGNGQNNIMPCGLQKIPLTFDQAINKSSIDTNGSEFRAISINGQPIPIANVNVLNSYNIEVNFINPIQHNDTILIYYKTGADGNTFLTTCGFESPRDTLTLIVQGCSDASLLENHKKKLSIYPNPSSGLVNLKGVDQYPISSILVLNLNGKVLKELNYQKGKALKLDEFESGLYILKLGFDDGTIENHSLILK